MKTETVAQPIAIVIAVAIISLVIYTLGSMFIHNQAVDTCMNQSIVKWTSETQSGYNYAPEWNKSCLQNKNI